MSAGPTIAPDAAMVLGIAATAMPFARSPAAEAERWLRILSQHGEVGNALQALGVTEAPLEAPERQADRAPATDDERDVIARVTDDAVRIASSRGADAVATTDVLLAVIHVYGADFDRVLQAHGTTSDAVVERLGAEPPGPSAGS
jgi:hypothetical protein